MSVCWFVCQTEDLVDLPVALGPKFLKHLRVSSEQSKQIYFFNDYG